MTVQFVDVGGQRMAFLPEAEYRALLDAAEERSDVDAAILAEARHKAGEECVPHSVVAQLVDGEPPLRVWRSYRGLSQEELAQKVGRQKAYISKLETGRSEGGVDIWRRLAEALNVDLDDLLPVD